MSRINSSVLWDYFDKIRGEKRAICQLCNEEYSFATTTGNLKSHLRKKHHAAFMEVTAAQERSKILQNAETDGDEKVIYEYIVAESPTTSVSNEPVEDNGVKKTPASRSNRIQSRESRHSISERRRELRRTSGKPTEKRLIEELTEEKIKVAVLQKDLVEKEIQEKNIRMQLLQEEMEHKKEMHIWEKREKEHKSQMNELEKQEMLLKIELLKANLETVKNKPSMSNI